MKVQRQAYIAGCRNVNIIPGESLLQEYSIAGEFSLYEVTQTIRKYLEDACFQGDYKNDIESALSNGSLIPAYYYEDLPKPITVSENTEEHTCSYKIENFDSLIRK